MGIPSLVKAVLAEAFAYRKLNVLLSCVIQKTRNPLGKEKSWFWEGIILLFPLMSTYKGGLQRRVGVTDL